MTPLHIIACSTTQDIELYRVLVDRYPENLVTEDRWGALPLLYAVWGSAPDEIIKYLVESYKSIYPDHLNWNYMVTTLGVAGVHVGVIQNLLDLQQEYFPDQLIDWDAVIESLVVKLNCEVGSRGETYQFLVKCGFMERINAIGLKHYRDKVINMVNGQKFRMPREHRDKWTWSWLGSFKSKLNQCEEECQRLKEATTMIELALWKMKLNNHEGKERLLQEV